MEIVFTNPCFMGDILCTIAPAQVWKRKTGAKITLIYEENKYSNPREPISILENEKSIDEIHVVKWNTIPRNTVDRGWTERFLGRPVDMHYDLHRPWSGSNGQNWFKYSGLDFKEDYTQLKFFPSPDDRKQAVEYRGHVGISDMTPDYLRVVKRLTEHDENIIIISEGMKKTLMEVFCIIDELKYFVTPCCLHHTLSWASNTHTFVCFTHSNPDNWFDFENHKTHTIKPYNEDKLIHNIEETFYEN